MRKNMLPMNLQLFADPEPSGQNAGGQPEPNGTPAPQAGQQEPPVIDVENINGMMPFAAVNADWDACPFTINVVSLSLKGTSGTPQLVISHSKIEKGQSYRINYGYWANV